MKKVYYYGQTDSDHTSFILYLGAAILPNLSCVLGNSFLANPYEPTFGSLVVDSHGDLLGILEE